MAPGYEFLFRLVGARVVSSGMGGAGMRGSWEDQKKKGTLKMDPRIPPRHQGHRRWVVGSVTAG
jgi:hypothetical protein